MHGPTCIFWASLTPFSLQCNMPSGDMMCAGTCYGTCAAVRTASTGNWGQVRKTPSWPRSWANFRFLSRYSHRNAWANLHLLGQPNTLLAAAARASHGGEPERRAAAQARGNIRLSLYSTAQPLYTRFPIIFGSWFSKVTIGYNPTRGSPPVYS